MPGETIDPIKLFADDAKLFHTVNTEQDCQQIQQDLNSLQVWAKKWQHNFHQKKCVVLRAGQGHPDLSITWRMEMKKSSYWRHFVKRISGYMWTVNSVLNTTSRRLPRRERLWRTFQYIDEDMFKTLYKTMIRSHLEYAAPVWSPYTWKLAEELEKVQRRATKRVPSLAELKYEERLRKLKLPTLIYRRIRGDLINVFKYMNNIYDINSDLFSLEKNPKPEATTRK